jgi:hypothetical protein
MLRRGLIQFIAFLLVALPVLGVFSKDTYAASSRVAVIKEMKGTVKVKKAGGSKQFTAFTKMSLNEGDVLAVGAGGSAVLQFSNGTDEDDKMTASANTTLTFSKLSNNKGTITKVSMLSGSVWSTVKSITNKEDQFTLETPTAVMGVRGTNLLVGVNPNTGDSTFFIASGVGQVIPKKSNSSGPSVLLNPSQQLTLDSNEEPEDISANVIPIDLQRITSETDSKIIEEIIKSKNDIDNENDEYIKKLNEQQSQPGSKETQEVIDRLTKNLDNLIGNIVKQAIEDNKVKEDEIQDFIDLVNEQIKDGRKLDLTKVVPLDLTAEDKLKQEELKKLQIEREKRIKELKEKADEQNRQNELTQKVLKEKLEKDRINKMAVEEKNKKAKADYESQLSELEKQKYTEEKNKRDKELTEATASPSASQSSNPSSQTPTSSTETPLSNDATLHSVVLKGNYLPEPSGSMSPSPYPVDVLFEPSFNPATTEYTAKVDNHVISLNLMPTVSESHATVKVNNQTVNSGTNSNAISLNVGINQVDIIVTAQNGTTKTYHFNVTRASKIPYYLTGWKTTLPEDTELFWDKSKIPYDQSYVAGVTSAVYGVSMQLEFNETVVGRIELTATYANGNVQSLSSIASGQVLSLQGFSNGVNKLEMKFFAPNGSPLGVPVILWFHNGKVEPNWNLITKPFTIKRVEFPNKEILYVNPDKTIMMVNANVRIVKMVQTLGIDPAFYVANGVTINGKVPGYEGEWYMPLSYGLNTVRVPVTDKTGYYQHTYEWTITRSDVPEGVDGLAVTKSDSSTALWTNMPEMDSYYRQRYYMNVPAGETKFHIKINSDPGVQATLKNLQIPASMPEIFISGDQIKTFTFTTPGFYRYLLEMNVDGVLAQYEFIFVVGTPDWEGLSSSNTSVNGSFVMPTVGGVNKSFSVVLSPYRENIVDTLGISLDPANIKVFSGTKELTYGYNLGHLLDGSQNDYELRVYDPTHQFPPKVYKLTVYIGSVTPDLGIASFTAKDNLTNPVSITTNPPSYRDWWDLTYVAGINLAATSVTMSIALTDTANAEISRVRVGSGDPIIPVAGVYTIPLSESWTIVEVVVRSKLTNREICYVVNLNKPV